MKKNRLLWLCAVLMMVVGMSSCSSDDPIEGQQARRYQPYREGFDLRL
jgi:hypothetical protein